MDGNAALLQQMLQQQQQQQQQQQLQQQPLQQQYQQPQPHQQEQQPGFVVPMQAYSYGQPGFPAPQFGLDTGFQQTAIPYGLPAQQQQQGTFLPGVPPAYLHEPLPDGGSGSLPPAILQHQQAALARQQQHQQQLQQQAAIASMALPGMTLPLVPPASVASNGMQADGIAAAQQPSWTLLQQAAAAVGAVPSMVPVLPLVAEQPAASTAQQPTVLGTLLAQQGAAGGGGAGAAPKRRGRQPKDPSTLTEKQLRAREAQKRFRDKQKRMMSETELAVSATSAELERLRVSNESQKLKNEVLERLLQYKEAQVHALEFQKQMDPPPRFTVSADMVDMMRREGIAGLFTPEVLLRYAVAGYTEHMDERGEVKEPPPFEKVAEDWRNMVVLVKEILDTARQTPGYDAEVAASVGAAEAATSVGLGTGPQFVELHSGSTAGATGSTGAAAATSSGDSGRRRGSPEGQGQHDGEERRVSFDRPDSLGQAPGRAAAAAAAAAGEGQGEVTQRPPGMDLSQPPGVDFQASVTGEALPEPAALAAGVAHPSQSAAGSGSAGSAQRRAAPLGVVPQDVLPEVAAIAEEAPDDVLEAAEAKDDPIARFVLARILSQTAAHSHLQWDTLVEGAAVQDGPDLYRFTGKQLRTLAHLMRRVGLMLWQQALLFPHHITKLGTLRLDDPTNLRVEEQDPEHWRAILRRLHCRPEQLRKIVAGHQRYMARMRPVLEERREALEVVKSITEMQVLSAFGPDDSTASFVASTTKLTEATGLVMQTVSAQHAAYCELLIAIFYALTFPVQRPQLFVLSWPYFPQLQLLGRAAALELGLDISQYPQLTGDGSEDL